MSIKRIDMSLPMPEYQTKGAAAFDIYAREEVVIQPKSLVRVPSNLIVGVPKGYFLMLALRSSTPKHMPGLMVSHGVGIVDEYYHGSDDEILIQVFNTSDQVFKIEKGCRFAQGVFVKIGVANFREQKIIGTKNRGGFGSTG